MSNVCQVDRLDTKCDFYEVLTGPDDAVINGLCRKDPFLSTLVEGYHPCRRLIGWLHQPDAMQVAYKILATWSLQDCLLMPICTVLMMSAGLSSRRCGNDFVRGEDSAGGHPPRKLKVPTFHRDQTYRYALFNQT